MEPASPASDRRNRRARARRRGRGAHRRGRRGRRRSARPGARRCPLTGRRPRGALARGGQPGSGGRQRRTPAGSRAPPPWPTSRSRWPSASTPMSSSGARRSPTRLTCASPGAAERPLVRERSRDPRRRGGDRLHAPLAHRAATGAPGQPGARRRRRSLRDRPGHRHARAPWPHARDVRDVGPGRHRLREARQPPDRRSDRALPRSLAPDGHPAATAVAAARRKPPSR